MIRFAYDFPVMVLGAAIVLVQSPVAVALTAVEVNNIAKAITVRIDGVNNGSGVIIDRQGNTYTVLTNRHVVQLKGMYTIQTPDGQHYTVNPNLVKSSPEVDLAIVQFDSTEDYALPELGDADQLIEGATVYVAGWAVPDAVSTEPSYRFIDGRISGRLPTNKAKNGYSLIYTNTTKPGMSGGPVLDEQGYLVGINGQAITDIRTGGVDFFGIPINTYLQLSSPSQNTVVVTQGSDISTQKFSASPPTDAQTALQVNSDELKNYAKAFFVIEPQRQQAFAEIKKIVGREEIPNIVCSDRKSFQSLPRKAKNIAVNYCQRSQKIVEDNNLTINKFDTIATDIQNNDDLKRQIDNTLIKLRINSHAQQVQKR